MNRIATQLACLVLVLITIARSGPARAEGGAGQATPALDGVGLDERLGQRVPDEVALTDHLGRSLVLADLLDDERPVILVLAYYRCPMLCGLTIEGVAQGLRDLGWTPGDEFRVVTVSFDPRDGAADAERARTRALETLELDVDQEDWPFLAGDERELRRLTDALGFHYAYDERTDQYAHPSAVFVLTPRGVLSRVLFGFEYPALDLRMALVEAGEGKVGSIADQVLITCYRYDPTERRYGFWVFGFLRLAGLILLVTLGSAWLILIRRDVRSTRALAPEENER